MKELIVEFQPTHSEPIGHVIGIHDCSEHMNSSIESNIGVALIRIED